MAEIDKPGTTGRLPDADAGGLRDGAAAPVPSADPAFAGLLVDAAPPSPAFIDGCFERTGSISVLI
jgi:hypothetical protein